MRLICANCTAQYEIAASAIPAAGREVKCSACGHVWHQAPPPAFGDALPLPRRPVDAEALRILREEAAREAQARAMAAPPAAADTPGADRPDEPAEPVEAGAEAAPALPEPDAPSEPAARVEPDTGVETGSTFIDAGPRFAAGAPPFEAGTPSEPTEAPEAAASEPAVLPETVPLQPETAHLTGDVALPEPSARPDPAPLPEPSEAPAESRVDRVIADVMPIVPAASPTAATVPEADAAPTQIPPSATRIADPPGAGDRGPAPQMADPKPARSTLEPATPQPRGGRFGAGFVLGLVVVAALAGIYVVAPGLAEDAPAAAPYLGAYVEAVDSARLWLDGVARPVMDHLRP